MTRIALMPDLRNGTGGPTSFQKRLAEGLVERGVRVDFDKKTKNVDALLLINATRHMHTLCEARRNGVMIVQRLGTPFPSNSHLSIGPIARIRYWLGIKNVAFIRSHIVDRIVYQSRFAQECWKRTYGPANKPSKVIYNGLDLTRFSPEGQRYASQADICIISVEGTQTGPANNPAILLAQALNQRGMSVELLIFGKPWNNAASDFSSYSFINFRGHVSNDELRHYYRGAMFFVSTDLIAGCPNSVIESLACGTPVIGYSLGVLPEMLNPEAGRCVIANGDPWRGEAPGNIEGLVGAALEIRENKALFRKGARRLAEERYGLDQMVDQYIDILSRE
jgi:glycosyltransferase involved in cell wall biosynthesis